MIFGRRLTCVLNFSTHSDVGSSGHSASDADLLSSDQKKEASEAISRWNPFEDPTPFSQVVTEEEDLFGKEFDKIRQEGETASISRTFHEFSYKFFLQAQNPRHPKPPPSPKIPFKLPFPSDNSELYAKMAASKSREKFVFNYRSACFFLSFPLLAHLVFF